jgi:ubiquitin C-terminal hydrolase
MFLQGMQQEPRKPIALKNVGSSCFMNAALQVAYAMHDVTSALYQEADIYKAMSLSEAYITLLSAFLYAEVDKEGLDSSTFSMRGWKQIKDRPRRQADANEFLAELLRCLAYKDIQEGQNNFDDEHLSDLAKLFYVVARSKAYAFHEELGFYESESRAELIPTLALPVEEDHTTLTQCLESFFKPAGENVLVHDAVRVVGERHTFLESIGRYVICSLDRESFIPRENDDELPEYHRNSNPVSFELYNQSFDKYFIHKEATVQGNYELIGVIMHSGSAVSGHYTSYVKSGNQWYYCNDAEITPMNEHDMYLIGQQGYGTSEETVPTTLVFEHSRTRAKYPAPQWIPAQAEPQKSTVVSSNITERTSRYTSATNSTKKRVSTSHYMPSNKNT